MSLFASWLASPPPDAAIEIAPERVSVAVVGERRGLVVGTAPNLVPASAHAECDIRLPVGVTCATTGVPWP